MPDGSKWDVPAEPIAKARTDYYATEVDGFLASSQEWKDEYEYSLNDSDDLLDYAVNNMNWDEFEDRKCVKMADPADLQEGWMNGDKEVVEY